MTCKWQCEIDPFCNKVLTKHWPDVPKFKDIKNLTVADGVPRRVDRLRSLGNAVVPQVVEIIGRFIMKIEDQI